MQGKHDMLAHFDSAKNKAKQHECETYHGGVAEAEIRKWLQTFLPKRYGVTSGYIISADQPEEIKSPHFDVIIYDQINSPTLWLEENPDTTRQGTSTALPAEHVRAVFEIKSRWTADSAKKAIEHLHDLDSLLVSTDDPNERYKKYLPLNFFCGVVFFEIKQTDKFNPKLLDNLIDANLRGYFGCIVLRGESLPSELAGIINLAVTTEQRQTYVHKDKISLIQENVGAHSNTIQISDIMHLGVRLMWSGSVFSSWAFDILTRLNGTYKTGCLSSTYVTTWRTSHDPNEKISSR